MAANEVIMKIRFDGVEETVRQLEDVTQNLRSMIMELNEAGLLGLNIQQAAKEALKLKNGCMYRRGGTCGTLESIIIIEPTDTTDCCRTYRAGMRAEKLRCPRWNPTASDLAANDWIVTELEELGIDVASPAEVKKGAENE